MGRPGDHTENTDENYIRVCLFFSYNIWSIKRFLHVTKCLHTPFKEDDSKKQKKPKGILAGSGPRLGYEVLANQGSASQYIYIYINLQSFLFHAYFLHGLSLRRGSLKLPAEIEVSGAEKWHICRELQSSILQ